MKLRTSYFNLSVLKKDITRFAPLWGLYTVLTVLFVLLSAAADSSPARFANNAADIMKMIGIVNVVYGGLCALLLFGDLFNTRLCNALHAMPMRREGWFLTHAAAGLLMCLAPNTLGVLLASAFLGKYCYLAFLWLAVAVLEFLFFFGVGVFSTMCAGNKLGMVAVYCLINFFAVLAGWLIECFYAPLLYGVVFKSAMLSEFSPAVRFASSYFVLTEFDNMKDFTRFLGFAPEDWWYLGVAAAVGAVALLGAALLYRKRKLEGAGDFIVLKPVAYVFLVLYSLGVGAVLLSVAVDSVLGIALLPFGIGLGFFTGRMILERKVNVFRGKNFLSYGVLVSAFIVTVLLTVWDPLGITRYVPQAQQVKYVSISPYSGVYYRQNHTMRLDDAEDVDTILNIHRDLALNRSYTGNLPLYICYEMADGTVVERAYDLEPASENGQKLKEIYSREECVLNGYSSQTVLERTDQIEFSGADGSLPYIGILPEGVEQDELFMLDKYASQEERIFHVNGSFADSELVQGLMEAIAQDCREGNMAQQYQFHQENAQVGWFYISFRFSKYEHMDIHIEVYDNCYHTLQYLKSIAEG